MKQDILIYLFGVEAASAGEVSQVIGHHPREVQDLLIQMDDDGDVLMKNGAYRLSEVSRLRALKRFDDGTI
jgi:predicted transcriptional regulator